MPSFRNKTIQGQVYDLSHLEPFDFEIEVGGQRIVVRVDFSCHCFTEAWTAQHAPDLRYRHKHEERAFCTIRHQLSLQLPDIIRNLGNRSVYHSQQGNFFCLKDVPTGAGVEPYLVFFSAFQAKGQGAQVRLLIRSAYLKPNMSRAASPVRFSTLIRFASEGRTPPLGPRAQIRRR